MGVLGSLAKIGTKVGLLGGVVYATYDQKIWSNADEGEKAYIKLKTLANENVELPDVKSMTGLSPEFPLNTALWNKGVTSTFEGMRKFPETASIYGVKAKDSVMAGIESLNSEDKK